MISPVVVTGIGCITPLGNSPDVFCRKMASLTNKKSLTDADHLYQNERKIKDFYFSDRELLQKYPRLDMVCQYILQATKQAVNSANLTPGIIENYRVGIFIGSTFGMFDSQEKFLRILYRTGKGSPMYFQQTANNLPSGIIAYKYRIDGINFTLYNGWTAGLDSIILGKQLISSKQVDIVIAGGVDILNETISSHYRSYISKKSLKKSFLPGEGAGIFILESEELARKRKQHIMGRIYDGQHRTFLRKTDFKQKLAGIISETNFSFYFSNLNGTKFDNQEKEIINAKNPNAIIFQNHIGECGAASGVLQALYALHLGSGSLIVNAGLGRISFLTI